MRISKFKIRNYKSFKETGDIELTSGINIITGQNNSGKTALLEALSTRFSSIPHRSTKTQLVPSSSISPLSEINIELKTNKSEVQQLFLNSANSQFIIRSVVDMNFGNTELSTLLNAYFPIDVTIEVSSSHF